MNNRICYGLLTLLFNASGVPAFMHGNLKAGVIQLILCCCTCGIFAAINGIMGIIMGIKIFMMTDEEFEAADKTTLVMSIPSPFPKAEAAEESNTDKTDAE